MPTNSPAGEPAAPTPAPPGLRLKWLTACALAAVAVGWAGYLKGFLEGFGIKIASAYSSAPFDWVMDKATHTEHFVSTGAVVSDPATASTREVPSSPA